MNFEGSSSFLSIEATCNDMLPAPLAYAFPVQHVEIVCVKWDNSG